MRHSRLTPSILIACPFCGTHIADQVYAAIFNGSFVVNALKVLAPFPLLVVAVGIVHWFAAKGPRQ